MKEGTRKLKRAAGSNTVKFPEAPRPRRAKGVAVDRLFRAYRSEVRWQAPLPEVPARLSRGHTTRWRRPPKLGHAARRASCLRCRHDTRAECPIEACPGLPADGAVAGSEFLCVHADRPEWKPRSGCCRRWQPDRGVGRHAGSQPCSPTTGVLCPDHRRQRLDEDRRHGGWRRPDDRGSRRGEAIRERTARRVEGRPRDLWRPDP
jgi:hypothetical protein